MVDGQTRATDRSVLPCHSQLPCLPRQGIAERLLLRLLYTNFRTAVPRQKPGPLFPNLGFGSGDPQVGGSDRSPASFRWCNHGFLLGSSYPPYLLYPLKSKRVKKVRGGVNPYGTGGFRPLVLESLESRATPRPNSGRQNYQRNLASWSGSEYHVHCQRFVFLVQPRVQPELFLKARIDVSASG
jgi:hypothetical protein